MEHLFYGRHCFGAGYTKVNRNKNPYPDGAYISAGNRDEKMKKK